MRNAIVGINRCEDYSVESIKKALEAIAAKTDFPDVAGKTVLLKPNILSGSSPDKAVTTHPEVVRAVIRLLFNKGAGRIMIGDSPGIGSADAAGKKCGIKDTAEQEGAEWVVFNETFLLKNPEGVRQKQFYPARQLSEADVLISLPKMKTHEMMYYTGAIKNLFGLIPGLKKSRFHFNFPEKEDFAAMIVDLFSAVKPAYAFMDGIVAMEGPGPGSGYPRKTGLLAGSDNLLALDWSMAEIMGYDSSEIPILKDALSRGTWLESPDGIAYPLLHPSKEQIQDFKRVKILKDTGFVRKILPEKVFHFFHNLYVPRPFFSHSKCIRCGKCIEICPAEALGFKEQKKTKKIHIDYNKCIRCYCCHEICPVDAIRIGRL